MEHQMEVMSDEDAVLAHESPEYRTAPPEHTHRTLPPQSPPPHGESALPAPGMGRDPGYDIPGTASSSGLARGADWKTTSLADISWCSARWQDLRQLCNICFTATNHDNIAYIDRYDTHELCKYIYDRIPELIRRYPAATSFGGCLDKPYPWQLSTDSALGPTTITYTVSHTLEHSESVTEGWAIGGSAGFNLGPLGGSVSTEYSHSRTNTTTWSRTGSTSSDFGVEAGHYGRIDVFATAGLYNGYLFFSTATLPTHPGDGRRCFDIGSRHILTSYAHYCFPVKKALMKSPNSPSPLVRIGQPWRSGTTPPATELPNSIPRHQHT